jgi:hypothetical protein
MKTKFKDIMFAKNFKTLEATFDIGSKAEAIANLAKDRLAEDGDLAKVHAGNILIWMEEMVEQVDKALALQLDNENK